MQDSVCASVQPRGPPDGDDSVVPDAYTVVFKNDVVCKFPTKPSQFM